MRVSRWIAGLVFVVAPIGVASSVHAGDSAEQEEISRIRVHFDSVLTELAARNVTPLSAQQRSNRSRLIAALTAYRARGVFPHNYDFADRATPYFIDRKTGTLCAVAHLLESTGRRDIVDRVARTNNNVWVAELAGDTALAAWFDQNGITLVEAARIQVPYVEPVSKAEEARNVAFLTVAPLAVGGAVVTSVWNALSNSDGHRRVVSWTGVVSGTLAATAGTLLLADRDLREDAGAVGVAAIGLGGLSLFSSTHSIERHRQIARTEREAERRRTVAEATLSPLMTGSISHPSVGASLSLRF